MIKSAIKNVGMFIGGLIVLFLIMYVGPELLAWAFAGSCILFVIIWPITKVWEKITGKKFGW